MKIVALGLLFWPLLAAAGDQSLTLSNASTGPESLTVYVQVGKPRPLLAAFQDPKKWVVVERLKNEWTGSQVSIARVDSTEFYDVMGQIVIELSKPLSKTVKEVDVVCLLGKSSRTTWKRRKDNSESSIGLFPVTNREKSDVYLSGSWLTGSQTGPIYNADASAALPIVDLGKRHPFRFSIKSSLKASDRPELDSDEYAVSARVATVFPYELGRVGRYLDLQGDLGRYEFNRKTEALNFVAAPGAILSLALPAQLRKDHTVLAATNIDVSLAVELGENLRNKLVPGGYGPIQRIVPGVGLHVALPGALGFQEVRWTTVYRVRGLLKKEPVVDVRTEKESKAIDRRNRPEWRDELLFKVNPLVGFTVKHEYGGGPPGFKLLDHRVSAGATVMWGWKKTGDQ